MTDAEKQTVLDMRRKGIRYAEIADSLGLSVNTVKSFCRRNILSESDASEDTGNEENKDSCKQCGQKLKLLPNAKPKQFCSDRCRYAWWSVRRDQLQHKAVYKISCAHCGAEFDSYGNKSRKYCSHTCYISARFGKEDRRDDA